MPSVWEPFNINTSDMQRMVESHTKMLAEQKKRQEEAAKNADKVIVRRKAKVYSVVLQSKKFKADLVLVETENRTRAGNIKAYIQREIDNKSGSNWISMDYRRGYGLPSWL